MTEYFYTKELGYADFAIKQKFEGVQSPMDWNNLSTFKNHPYWHDGFYKDCKAWRFFKSPHNMALMEVQQGDLVQTSSSNWFQAEF